ncbi:MAG: PfkB family carbohydrate kinase [Thermosphaera sp.]
MTGRSKSYIHVSVGNLNLDVVTYVERPIGPDESLIAESLEIRPGGAAANYAVATVWFGHKSFLISSISNHELARTALQKVYERGVVTTYVKTVDDAPGMVIIMVYPDGNRSMIRFLGANRSLSPGDVPLELLKESNVVHMASINPSIACEIASVAKKYVPLVSYDPGGFVATAKSKVLKTLKHVNLLFLNKEEAFTLSEGSITRLLDYDVEILAVKLGSKGAVAFTNNKAWHSFAEPVEKIVDTTGSGDAFNAVFNSVYIETGDLERALKYGVAAGTLKASCRGSFICKDKRVLRKQLLKTIVKPFTGDLTDVIRD